MTRITSFMRVTKKPKVHREKVTALTSVKKPLADKKVIVDDGERVSRRDDEESSGHIPTFVYETVKYKHKAESRHVSKELKLVMDYIKQLYVVPRDFEQNAKFGCYSGLTYEKRVARAYSLGQLSCKKYKGKEAPKPICLTCATVGHTSKQCPEGF